LSILEFDMNLYEEAKSIIDEGSYYIKNYPLYYPTLTKAFFKEIFKIYVITSSKPLYKENFYYPYILWKKGDDFEICTIKSCIKKSNDLKSLLEEIQ